MCWHPPGVPSESSPEPPPRLSLPAELCVFVQTQTPRVWAREMPVSGTGRLAVMELQGPNQTEFPASPKKGSGTAFLDGSETFS